MILNGSTEMKAIASYINALAVVLLLRKTQECLYHFQMDI